MYLNLHQLGLGGFANNGYWISNEVVNDGAWRQYFFNGNQNYYFSKTSNFNVRAVGAF